MYKKNITIDIDRPYTGRIPSVQYDNNRQVIVKLVSNGKPVNLDGVMPVLTCTKPDGNKIYNSVEVVGADEGEVRITLTQQINSTVGQVSCNLQLFDGEDGLVSTQVFYIAVGTTNADVKVVESSNEFNALTEAMNRTQGFSKRISGLETGKLDKGGEITVSQINKNKGKLDQTYMSDELLQQIAGNTPVSAVPANGSITAEKIASNALGLEHLSKPLFEAVRHSGFTVLGTPTIVNKTSSNVTLSWQRLYLRTISDGRVKDYKIKPSTENMTVGNNQLMYVDLNQPIGDEYEIQLGTEFPNADHATGDKFTLLHCCNGLWGGELAKILGIQMPSNSITNGMIKSEAITPSKTSIPIQNNLKRVGYQLLVAGPVYYNLGTNNLLKIVGAIPRMYLFRGSDGNELLKIAEINELNLSNMQGAYIDLDSARNSDGTYPVLITDNFNSALLNGEGGFKDDRKVLLLCNCNQRIGGLLAPKLMPAELSNITGKIRQNIAWFKNSEGDITFDLETRTLKWNCKLIGVLNGVNQNRIKLDAGQYTFKAEGYNVLYLDTDLATEKEYNDPDVCLSDGAYHLGGYSGQYNQIPIASYNHGFKSPFSVINFPEVTVVSPSNNVSITNFERDTNIYAHVVSGKEITIYRQSSAGENIYMGQKFVHGVAAFDPSGENDGNNADVWRLNQMFIYQKDGSNFTRLYPGAMIHAGEWETALQEKGSNDFIGGNAHGDELMTDIVCLFDGKPINLNITANYVCKNITILEHSNLFRCNSGTDLVAKHVRHYEINANEIVVTQKVEWLQDILMTTSYLTMLPIRRHYEWGSSDTPTTPAVTNRGFKNNYWEVLDLTHGHKNGTPQKGVTKATIWNDGPGYQMTATVEVLEHNNLPNSRMSFTNAVQYNKFYFDYCGPNYQVTAGEIWNNKARYTYDYMGYVE